MDRVTGARPENILGSLGHVTPIVGEEVSWSLESRMATYRVPAVSIAIIDNGKLVWSEAFGQLSESCDTAVTANSLFQAASMSKPVNSLAILRDADQGNLDLDQNVNEYLSQWQVPDNELLHDNSVTLRRILSHTAGLTVWGFTGYAEGQPVPSVPQLLSGQEPANSEPVEVDVEPGTIERYSGGGTTIAQLVLEEVHDRCYEDILQQQVLNPLGMLKSTFCQPLPDSLADIAAAGHDWDGAMIEGRWHTYPEKAAAGLWTTSADYARFLLGLQTAYLGQAGAVIGAQMAQQMATIPPGGQTFGLGPRIIGKGRARRFQHGGSNAGYKCGSCAFMDGSRGAVVLTNSDNGSGLAEEIFIAIARVFEWPDYIRAPRRRLDPGSIDLGAYTGTYLLGPSSPFDSIEILSDEHTLVFRLGTLPERPLFPETKARFFSPESLYDTEFQLDEAGNATELLVFDENKVLFQATRAM